MWRPRIVSNFYNKHVLTIEVKRGSHDGLYGRPCLIDRRLLFRF